MLRLPAKHAGVYHGGVELDTTSGPSSGGPFPVAPPGTGVLVGHSALRVR